jgi:hypothetical protein
MSGDKTSRDKTSEGKNEGVEGQNAQWDKTSRGTKLPADKTSMGKKNPETYHTWHKTSTWIKTSVGTKRPKT